MTDQFLQSNIPPSRFSFLKTKLALVLIGAVIVLGIGGIVTYQLTFAAPQPGAGLDQFTNPTPTDGRGGTPIEGYGIAKLKGQGFIKSEIGFKIAFALIGGKEIQPGAYKLSKAMTAWEAAKAIKEGPNLVWVMIPEGLRKEQIAELLAPALKWDEATKEKWITTYTSMSYDEIEGVYFPDTYLIPIDEEPLKVVSRLRSKFNEMLQPYTQEALKQNIKWTTALKLASIVQREAAGKDDMPLIAGILWNRLLKDEKLEVDATVQYVRDDQIHYGEARYDKQPGTYTSEGTWWTPIKSEDKDIPSPYNTYRNKGLPPHPIANPGIDAIKAVLYPEETECMFYLHDKSKTIHCAKTFEEHKANITTYLSD